MRSIAVINQKGGCGKTTVAINLSAALAAKGKRTLLVDMDPQSHCAVGLAVPEEQIERNIYDVLIAAFTDEKVGLKNVVWQIAQNFDLAPAGIELAALEQQLSGRDRREDGLRRVLTEQAGDYDYVVIDCPPSVGLLTFNALRSAQDVLIPVETGYFALHGLTRQLETLHVLQEQCGQDVRIRVLASMYDVRTKLAREVLGELRKHHDAQMCEAVINFNTKLKEAASFGQPITEYDPASKGMKDFMNLAEEFLSEESAISEAAPVAVAVGQAAPAGQRFQPQAPAPAVSDSSQIDAQMDAVEAQLRSMSKTATEILAESAEAGPQRPAQDEGKTLQEKIDQIYGVRQDQGVVRFVALYPQAGMVQVAGDFNNWQPEQAEMAAAGEDGQWVAEMKLPPGTYRYRYVVDGRWQQDPYNSEVETNPFGELNSVVTVK